MSPTPVLTVCLVGMLVHQTGISGGTLHGGNTAPATSSVSNNNQLEALNTIVPLEPQPPARLNQSIHDSAQKSTTDTKNCRGALSCAECRRSADIFAYYHHE